MLQLRANILYNPCLTDLRARASRVVVLICELRLLVELLVGCLIYREIQLYATSKALKLRLYLLGYCWTPSAEEIALFVSGRLFLDHKVLLFFFYLSPFLLLLLN